jgi:hypothetical protein
LDNGTYNPNIPNSGSFGPSYFPGFFPGEYELIAQVGAKTATPIVLDDRGDSNRFRDQGQIIVQSSRIENASGFGIVATGGPRDTDSNAPHQGPPQILREVNTQRLARGVVIQNNVVAGSRTGAINFGGTPTGEPAGAVPFGHHQQHTVWCRW